MRSVAVVGAGTMGSGIATAFAQSGFPVLLKEVSNEALGRGMANIRANFDRAVAKNRLTPEVAQNRLASIRPQTDFSGFDQVDLVVEAVFENLPVKQAVMEDLGKAARPDCILATNTSSLDVNAIASGSGRSEKTIGLHFFSPANVMRLVEVVPGAETDPGVTATCMSLGKRLGKIAVLAGNRPGFIGNRIFRPYLREARFLVEEGASVEEVNEALVQFGMSMGPLAVDDLIGIDVSRHIEDQFRQMDPPGVRRSMRFGSTLRCWPFRTENRSRLVGVRERPETAAEFTTHFAGGASGRGSRARRHVESAGRRSWTAVSAVWSTRVPECLPRARPNGRQTSMSCSFTAMVFLPGAAARCSGRI